MLRISVRQKYHCGQMVQTALRATPRSSLYGQTHPDMRAHSELTYMVSKMALVSFGLQAGRTSLRPSIHPYLVGRLELYQTTPNISGTAI